MRARTWLGALVCSIAVAALMVLASDGRHAGGWWLLLCPVLGLAGIGMLATTPSVWWTLPLPVAAVVVGTVLGEPTDPFNAMIVMVVLGLLALGLFPLGTFVARHVRRPKLVAALATALLAGALGIPALSVAETHRIVRHDRHHPMLLDERAGTFRGVRLGESGAQLQATLGPGKRVDDYIPVGQVTRTLSYGDGLDVGLDADDRVVAISTTDPRTQTRRGLGVGDSMRLFGRSYGSLDCHEGSVGSDWPTPYPTCDFNIPDTDNQLYAEGTYDRAGGPAYMLVLSSTG